MTAYHHVSDQVAFFPADNAKHSRVYCSGATLSTRYTVQIPAQQLGDCVECDEGILPREHGGFLPRRDSVLRECMIRLRGTVGPGVRQDIGSEIAARSLVVRLSELLGGKSPAWQNDSSVFTPLVMNQIMEYIDSRLPHPFCLEELATLTGCSPSHFARKFRRSEGLSLGRFINRRRVAAALVLLRNDSAPLSRIALSLGFSSQSHFTRLFSQSVGVTPLKYRNSVRPIVA